MCSFAPYSHQTDYVNADKTLPAPASQQKPSVLQAGVCLNLDFNILVSFTLKQPVLQLYKALSVNA